MGAEVSQTHGHGGQRMLACLLAVAAWGSAAIAGDASTVVGTYCLQGVHEVGSCMRLSPDGKYEYFLSYGAYDETSEGTWRIDGSDVVLDSPAYDKRPGFVFKRLQPGASGGYDVLVESKSGQPLPGIEVSVACDGKTAGSGITQQYGFAVACTKAPTAVTLGLSMFGLAPQSIDVAAHTGADKGYVFEFEPGDLGKKRFAGTRAKFTADALEMTYTDTPISELQGRPFRYVRDR
ncbi:MAG: hypothetical protein ACK4TP_12160 [Hyphomicrobium sp.]